MKISTVIPNHNDAATLRKSVESACTQRPAPHEVILLDDASTDDSREVGKELVARFPMLTLYHHPEKSDDWLRDLFLSALPLTTGDYIHFLAADDYLMPGFYAAAGVCDSGVILGGVSVTFDGGGSVCLPQLAPGANRQGPTLLRWCGSPRTLPCGAVTLFRRDVMEWMVSLRLWKLGPWNDSVGIPIAAWRFGLDYIPTICAVHSRKPGRYGSAVSPERMTAYRQAAARLGTRLRKDYGISDDSADAEPMVIAAALAKLGESAPRASAGNDGFDSLTIVPGM